MKLSRPFCFLLLVSLGLLSSGCDTYYIPPPAVFLSLISPEPQLVITAVDSNGNIVPASEQLQVTVSNTSNQAVTYSVGQDGIYVPGGNQVLGFVNNSGVYTAPAVVPTPNNTVTIQGVAQADTHQVATANITLLNQGANPTSLAPSVVTVGQSYTFDVVGNYFAPGLTVSLGGATLGPVQIISSQELKIPALITAPGLLSLTVNNPESASNTNTVGIRSQPSSPPSSSTIAVLVGSVGKDSSGHTITATKGYIPEPASLAVVNLDANKQIRSVVMPNGYQPSMAAADPAHNQVVAASTGSNILQLIDAVQDEVSQPMTVPVSTTTTVDGQTCMVCGLMVDSSRSLAILDTAAGYFTLDLTTGIASTPLIAPAAANFAYDPKTERVFAPFANANGGGINVIDLAAGTVSSVQPGSGIQFDTATDSAAFDPSTQVLVAGDRNSGNYLQLNFNSAIAGAQTTQVPAAPFSITHGCVGDWNNLSLDFNSHVGWFSNLGSCVGVATLMQAPATGAPGQPAFVHWAQVPVGPDGLAWTNTSVGSSLAVYLGSDGRAYGLAVRSDSAELLKMDLGYLQSANAVVGGADANQVDPTNVTVNAQQVSAMVYIPLR